MAAQRRRKRFDDATLAVMQRQYEEAPELTLDDIGALHGCSGALICKLAKEHGWKRRRPAAAQGADAPPPPPRPRRRRDPYKVIVRRMHKVISGKLKEMEEGVESGSMTPADQEHGTKVVTSMIGGLQKVAAQAEADMERGGQADSAGGKDEVERLQREIIERFERIQRRREAEARSQ